MNDVEDVAAGADIDYAAEDTEEWSGFDEIPEDVPLASDSASEFTNLETI